MKDVLIIIIRVLALLLIPAIFIYFAGAFVMLDWNWIPLISKTDRLAIAGVLFILWIILTWLSAYITLNDDRRDPEKKGPKS